jgi:hypothetical protein
VDVQASEMDVNLNQTIWDHEILYDDRSLKYEKPLLDNFCDKPKIRMWRAIERLQFIFCFMEITHETLHLDK